MFVSYPNKVYQKQVVKLIELFGSGTNFSVRPMNLAWKRRHEELTSWSSRPSTKYFFPYRTQFQIIGPHRPASWANRQTGPPVSKCLWFYHAKTLYAFNFLSVIGYRFGEQEIDVKTVSIAQVECWKCGQGSEERMVKESPQFAP